MSAEAPSRRCASPDCSVPGGAVLSRFNDSDLCWQCARRPRVVPPFAGIGPAVRSKYVAPTDYDARDDPDYIDKVAVDLLSHWGCWRRLHKTIGGNFETVREAVEVLRRLGFEVEGDRALGYRVVDFHRRRYLRPAKVCSWPADEVDPNQLSMDCCRQ